MPTQSAAGSTSRKEKSETNPEREPHELARTAEEERVKRDYDSTDDLFNLAHTD